MAMWVEAPRVYKNRSAERTYNPVAVRRKNEYLDLLQTKKPLISLRHQDFKARDLIKLRTGINTAFKKSSPKDEIEAGEAIPPQLVGIRTSALGVALRECEHLDQLTRRRLKTLIGKGSLFILTLPTLHPPQLFTLLRTLDRAVPPKKPPPTPAELAKIKAEQESDFVPGKQQKRQRPKLIPQLEVACALIEGKAYEVPMVKEIATLPALGALHSQIVGLISSPAAQIAGILGQASGGQLLRTLQGYQKSLEEREGSASS